MNGLVFLINEEILAASMSANAIGELTMYSKELSLTLELCI
jgi:hypothetical protein